MVLSKEEMEIVKRLAAPIGKLVDCLGIYKEICEKWMKEHPEDMKDFGHISKYDEEE
jgi:hypothetical protein